MSLPTHGRVGLAIRDQYPKIEDRKALAMSVRWMVGDDARCIEEMARESVEYAKEVLGIQASSLHQQGMLFATLLMSFAVDDSFGLGVERRTAKAAGGWARHFGGRSNVSPVESLVRTRRAQYPSLP
jgi:hypothetical protein